MDYDELIESWVNGNRKDVAAELLKMKRSEVLAFAVEFVKAHRNYADVLDELGHIERAVQRAEEK